MIACSSCGRHHQEPAACPFCGTAIASDDAPVVRPTSRPLVRKAFHLIGGAVTTVVLAACYGMPPGDDLDNDGRRGRSGHHE